MAITAEQFNRLDQEKNDALMESMDQIMGRLHQFRESRLVLGLPFNGRLAQTYERFFQAYNTLFDSVASDEELQEALDTMDSFGGFLNLKIPGAGTLRSRLTDGKEEDVKKLKKALQTVRDTLNVQTDQQVAPLYDFRRDNHRAQPANIDYMNKLLGEAGTIQTSGNQPYHNALESLSWACDKSLEKFKKDGINSPEDEANAREFLKWRTALRAAYLGDHTERCILNVNGIKQAVEESCTKGDALKLLRDDFDAFLQKKIRIGKENPEIKTGEGWLIEFAKDGKKHIDTVKKLLDPKTLTELRRGAETETAAAHIAKLMNRVRTGMESCSDEILAGVFGARMAVNARRNDLKGLKNSQITKDQRQYYQDQLLENDLFKRFCKENRDALKDLMNKRGHGGALEDRFRAYLCKLPAGELSNEPLLQRYMPTYLERIEALQEQIKTAKNNGDARDAMAEIVVLRGLAGAERGSKASLDIPIQTDGSNLLKNNVEILKEKADFQQAAFQEGRFAREGHGGKLVEKLREYLSEEQLLGKGAKKDPSTLRLLHRTTYGGQKDSVRVKAWLMLEEINNGKQPDERMKLGYRDLWLEYAGLRDAQLYDGKQNTDEVDWQSIRQKAEVWRSNPRLHLDNVLAMNENQMKNGLEALFRGNGTALYNAFPDPADRQAQPVQAGIGQPALNKQRGQTARPE